MDVHSPKITNLKWGSVRIETGEQYKDAKLWPGGSRASDWNETGTSHSPGIQPADIEELLAHDAVIVILSRGQSNRLKTPESTIAWLEKKGVHFKIMNTRDAVEEYNRLPGSGEKVGALIHSTC